MITKNRTALKRIVGKFPSKKMGCTVMWGSQLERDFLYLLEFDSDVRSFKEKSVTINYKYKNKSRRYTPDFCVERYSTMELIEVKHTTKVNDPKNIIRFLAAAAYCKNKGYVFKVVTEEQIREGNLLSNIKLLHRYATVNVSSEFYQKIIEIIQNFGEISLGELIAILKENYGSDAISNIYALLYHHILIADFRKPLSDQIVIKACQIKI